MKATELYPDIENEVKDQVYDNFICKGFRKSRDKIIKSKEDRSIGSIWGNKEYSFEKKTRLIAHLYEHEVDLKKLEEILHILFKQDHNILENKTTNERTNLKRLIRIFDYLKYKKSQN